MQTTRSLWLRARALAPRRAPLARDAEVDVAIVGAGITGLTLAKLLQADGRRVAVLERGRVAGGTTGHSTAHLSVALDTDYCTLATRFGEAQLRLVLESVTRAIDEIERGSHRRDHGCGFRRVPGFRFAEDAKDAERLEQEALCAQRAGLELGRVTSIPLPVPCAAALRFEAQAELDPVAYCAALQDEVVAGGGILCEDTPVVEATDGGVVTAAGPRLRAAHVIEATHTPIGRVPWIQTRVTAFTSHVLAVRLSAPIEHALYWDCADPYHYIRAADADGRLVLIGGEDHRTGREERLADRASALEQWVRKRLPVESVVARWSHELFEPADGLPYIGLLPGSRSHFVAAGYSGTGITFGTVAALLLRDLVVKGSSPWQEVYAPSRLKPLAAGPRAVRENLAVAWRRVADRLRGGAADSVSALAPGTGEILRVEGERVAAYREPSGELHLLSPTCTHLGCTVSWNDLDKTWDCPCHGGRFCATGEPLYGPPVSRLEPADAEEVAEGARTPARAWT